MAPKNYSKTYDAPKRRNIMAVGAFLRTGAGTHPEDETPGPQTDEWDDVGEGSPLDDSYPKVNHDHPLLRGGTVGLMSAEAPKFTSHVPEGMKQKGQEHEHLRRNLRTMSLNHVSTDGKYEVPEKSVIISKPDVQHMIRLGEFYGQESVIHSSGGVHKLIYTNGPLKGGYRTTVPGEPPYVLRAEKPGDYYTHIPGHGYLTINFDFSDGAVKDLQDDRPRPDLEEAYRKAQEAEAAKSQQAQSA
jgi:hypothetical protein